MRKIESLKKCFTFLTIIFTLSLASATYAQAPDPNDFFDEDPNPNDAPIDENLFLLMGAGLFFGFYFINSNKKEKAIS